MENYFNKFRQGIIGINAQIATQEGTQKVVYADWTASGRNYAPIENRIQQQLMPLVANTHTETSTTGMAMTHAYHEAQGIIKKHVNANQDDLIITATSGMTRLVNKLQRILGLKYREMPPEDQRPVVFITHMEHHSNHTSWLETLMTVEIIQPTAEGLVDLHHLDKLLENYQERPLKIASVTACSNVTGIMTPYHQIAQKMHRAGGYCFVDFACSAPYVAIDMHPAKEEAHLDAIFFSPHKFLGGPGSAGVLIFSRHLYQQRIPDNPGGGTVDWTNPWGKHKYIDNIEAREDGGTPAFLQTIKTAMCITLKQEMGVANILKREHELLDLLWDKVAPIPNVHILASQHRDRLAILSFYIDGLHYNSGVKLLNDKFGIQSRGGCSCAGTYGHYLLNVNPQQSQKITDMINQGDFSNKPGWIRISLHPTMTNDEVVFIADGIEQLAKHHEQWCQDYGFEARLNGLSAQSIAADNQLKEAMAEALTADFATTETGK
ncbi:aminotransferase class V-fold PLP-dependent enzyme [Microscilla marina]|uniref:Aminotransferase n=1 Tax=Microscilla marina ATCC 23134 TaxID=313606 RepID=A1ZI13_MICM2|nr:aminotransferase class V-fold PLP-dependent enzyme [Microscilla marina]EAY30170.1 aminotransferase [Microscilla marina ATCC 23134]